MGADLAFHEGEEIFFRVKGELPATASDAARWTCTMSSASPA